MAGCTVSTVSRRMTMSANISTEHGTCSKIARMIHKGPPDATAHLDLARQIDRLAKEYQMASGSSYSASVNAILKMNPTVRAAYQAYTSDKGVALPLRDTDPETTHHDVTAMVTA